MAALARSRLRLNLQQQQQQQQQFNACDSATSSGYGAQPFALTAPGTCRIATLAHI
jgi:hypothetical protein